jgi:saccharopine dehydrogenase-like NADP-dependent oxidoreductase
MKVLLIGVGGVGEMIAVLAKDRPWLETLVLADYNETRVQEVYNKLGAPAKFVAARLDASDQQQIVALAKKHDADLIMNAVAPIFAENIFDAAYQRGCMYIDTAMTISHLHPTDPYRQCGVKLGDYQFARSADWEKKGLIALCGMGVEPGMADVFAKYAEKHLFDEIDEIGVRDGANIEVKGYDFAPSFSIWTTIEECLNPPIIWEKEKGWFTTEPFSEPEIFDFPEGIGPCCCVNVEHEEVILIPHWIKCRRVTFKYGLGEKFINVLKTIKMLGLDNKEQIDVKGVKVSPRDVVAACLPDPAHLGDKMDGKTCAGTLVKGVKDGKAREVYIYQVADNTVCMKNYGVHAVVAQTAFNPVIAMELLETGAWRGKGVLGPEVMEPEPFMEKMASYGFPYQIREKRI